VDNSELLRTEDGGLHWTARLRLAYPKLFAADMAFPDASHGYAVMDELATGPLPVRRFVATDDAGSWTTRALPPGTIGACGIDFATPTEGWLLVQPAGGACVDLFHTTDGGRTWKPFSTIRVDPSATLQGMRFADASHGWVRGSVAASAGGAAITPGMPFLAATSDGGGTWQVRELPPSPDYRWPEALGLPQTPHFFDVSHAGVAVAFSPSGQKGDDAMLVYTTSNGGVTWDPPRLMPFGNVTWTAVDRSHWWVGGRHGVQLSADGGRTWSKPVSQPGAVTSLDFVNERVGYADGELTNGQPAIYRTADGGRMWTALPAAAGCLQIAVHHLFAGPGAPERRYVEAMAG